MFNRFRNEDEGFTLIELLVVVIIIGILAAIAIPTFLSQRERGWQAELTSGVRNAALEIEAAATAANGEYPAATDVSLATDDTVQLGNLDGPDDADDVPAITFYYAPNSTAPAGFELCGTDSRISGENSVLYDTDTGGLQPFATTDCTLTAAVS